MHTPGSLTSFGMTELRGKRELGKERTNVASELRLRPSKKGLERHLQITVAAARWFRLATKGEDRIRSACGPE